MQGTMGGVQESVKTEVMKRIYELSTHYLRDLGIRA